MGLAPTSVPVAATDPVKFADGNPYGVSHVTGADNDAPLTEVEVGALDHMAERAVDYARRLKASA